MPTYDYLCDQCGKEFEAFHSMSADPLTDCQLCGAQGTVRRKIGLGAGIIFKGSGFYETDFKDKKGGTSGGTKTTSASSDSDSPAKESKKPSEPTASSTPAGDSN